MARGTQFRRETDAETIAHLMEGRVKAGESLLDALRGSAGLLAGSQAIVAMSPDEAGVMVAARLGNAGGVVIGYGEGEMVLASDLAAVLPVTQRVAFLADGQFARIDKLGASFVNVAGEALQVPVKRIPIDPVSALKGDYQHFMLKELMEQPEAL